MVLNTHKFLQMPVFVRFLDLDICIDVTLKAPWGLLWEVTMDNHVNCPKDQKEPLLLLMNIYQNWNNFSIPHRKQPQNEPSRSHVFTRYLLLVPTTSVICVSLTQHPHLSPPPITPPPPSFSASAANCFSTLAGLPFLVIETSAVQPYRRGFYCDDESIKYPAKNGDTISDGVLSGSGILITILSVSHLTLTTNVITSSRVFSAALLNQSAERIICHHPFFIHYDNSVSCTQTVVQQCRYLFSALRLITVGHVFLPAKNHKSSRWAFYVLRNALHHRALSHS